MGSQGENSGNERNTRNEGGNAENKENQGKNTGNQETETAKMRHTKSGEE